MKKIIITSLLCILIVSPLNTNAQSTVEEQYKASLIQIIELLQKQLALLLQQKYSIAVTPPTVKDMCPNLQGIQTTIPNGMVYSRIHDKCLTLEGLDGLEAINDHNDQMKYQCRESKKELTNLRNQYIETNKRINSQTKSISQISIGNPIEIKDNEVGAFLSWVRNQIVPTTKTSQGKIGYIDNVSRNMFGGYVNFVGTLKTENCNAEFSNYCNHKEGVYDYSEEVIQKALAVILLEKDLNKLQTQIYEAENKADKVCR
jgi:hypothetical protein